MIDRKNCFFFLLGLSIGTFISFVFKYRVTEKSYGDKYSMSNFKELTTLDISQVSSTSNLTKLITLAREIHIAKQHARGTKTGRALHKATKLISNILESYKIKHENIIERQVIDSVSVCQEVYKGMKFGYPLFKTGFVNGNCTYYKKLESLITLLFIFESENMNHLDTFISSIYNYSSTVNFRINVRKQVKNKEGLCKEYKTCLITSYEGSDGYIWNRLVKDVSTPYILVGRDVIWFNEDTRLERLIRQIERLQVSVAGGSFRNVTGHWFIGCQQNVLRNYTLVYEAGYDESKEECQFCDHIDGPFVIKTNLLKQKLLNSHIRNDGLFEDFFLRLQSEKVVCPDSLFFRNNSERSVNPNMWSDFQSIWKIKKISFAGTSIVLPCTNDYKCSTVQNGGLTPCCLEELADLIATFFQACNQQNILCELDSGSGIGAVKFHGILPWEKDGDTVFLSYNYTAILNEKDFFKSKGYQLFPKDTRKYKGSTVTGGYFDLKSKNWNIEVWGMPYIQSQETIMLNHSQTKVNVNGHWVTHTRNPALYARNRYGHEIFKHVQHWSEMKLSSSWELPKMHQFNPCGQPLHQSCLDSYNADGNLQFKDPIP